MSDTTSATPAAAPTVAGPGGCCGNPAQATLPPPHPAAETGGPCCGTPAEAQQAGSCCGTTARRQAVDAGQGCCG
jgi:hypothetical protein